MSTPSPVPPPPKKWDARTAGHITHNTQYYAKCLLGGVLACGLTHALITPLDVTKCNMQVNPTKYKGLVSGLKSIVAEEGAAAVWKGWFPTLIGYSLQGAFKYGLYEFFKDTYSNALGEENSKKYRSLVWCAGSASAEVFADIALCPFEMVKVKVQTSKPGSWPTDFFPAVSKMNAEKAETRFPYGSIVPLWSRQIPYTVAKFFFFEKIVQLFYTHVFTAPKDTYSKPTQLGVTFSSGYLAGVVCAIVSHPADSLVSQLSKADNKGKSIGQIASEVGIANLATKGLATRVLMIGTLTGLQWWIYDSFKAAFGLGTTGGK
jgi:solute carrier family 25 phosphate transporter 3